MSLAFANSFNENSGTTIRDYSDNLRDSASAGGLTPTADTFGYYMRFDGASSQYTIASFTLANFTYYFEFYTNDATTKRFILSRRDHSYIFIENNRLTFGIHNEATAKNVQTAGNSISTATWYKCACFYDGTDLNVWLDGVEVTSTQSNALTQTNAFTFGSEFDSTDYFNGRLREFRAYTTGLSDNAINSISTSKQGIIIGMDAHSFNVGDLVTSKLGETRQSAVVFATDTNEIRVLPDADNPVYFKGQKWIRFGHRWDTARQDYLVLTGETTKAKFLTTNGNNQFSETDDTNKTTEWDSNGLRRTTLTKTANYTLEKWDFRVIVDTSSAVTITLPASPDNDEEHVITRSGANNVTINGNGKNIIGNATQILYSDNDSLHL